MAANIRVPACSTGLAETETAAAGHSEDRRGILGLMIKTLSKTLSLTGLFRLLAVALCGFLWMFEQTADDVISLFWRVLLDSRLFQHESFEVRKEELLSFSCLNSHHCCAYTVCK